MMWGYHMEKMIWPILWYNPHAKQLKWREMPWKEAEQLSPCGKRAGFGFQGLWMKEMDLEQLPGLFGASLNSFPAQVLNHWSLKHPHWQGTKRPWFRRKRGKSRSDLAEFKQGSLPCPVPALEQDATIPAGTVTRHWEGRSFTSVSGLQIRGWKYPFSLSYF